jgi:hypothetical protein
MLTPSASVQEEEIKGALREIVEIVDPFCPGFVTASTTDAIKKRVLTLKPFGPIPNGNEAEISLRLSSIRNDT